MGKFQKGQPRPAGAGRRKGAANKVTVTVRNAWEAAFGKLQKDKERNLLAWAKDSPENLKVFYGLSTKLMPLIELNVEQTRPHIDASTPEGLLEGARRIAFVLAKAARLVDETPSPIKMLTREVSEPEEVAGEVLPAKDSEPGYRHKPMSAEEAEDLAEQKKIERAAKQTVSTFMGNAGHWRR